MIIRWEIKDCNRILTKNQKNISALSSGKTNTCEYLTGEGMLPDQSGIAEKAKSTYSLFGPNKNNLKECFQKEWELLKLKIK